MDLRKEWVKALNHPSPRMFWLKFRIYSCVLFKIAFKVTDTGLYKIIVEDRNGIAFYTGYTWCGDEYRFHRGKRIKRDLKSRHMKLPRGRYKIKYLYMEQLIREESLPGIRETVMWTKPDFNLHGDIREIGLRQYSLHDNILRIINKTLIGFKEKITEKREKVSIGKKIISSLVRNGNLLEAAFFDYEDKCAFKCFIVSDNDDHAFSVIKNDLKNKGKDLKEIKELVFKTYEKENFGVIWVN
jgi:hypothetical protein